MTDLAPCPCGEIPKALGVDTHRNTPWAIVYGECCGTWSVEFRTTYTPHDPQKFMAEAERAWNNAPRTKQTTCEWQETRNCDWTTACGAIWRIQEEGPTGEDLTYCPHCGDKILAKPYERE